MTSRFKLHLASAVIATALTAPALADSHQKTWSQTFGDDQNESVVSVLPLANGGVAIAATTDSVGNGGTDAWVFTLDSSGGMIWDETIGGKKDDSPTALIQMPDGGFAMSGVTDSKGKGGTAAWVVRLDAKGNVLWEKTFGKEGDDEAVSLVSAPNGGLTVAGMTDPKGPEHAAPWIARLDAKGNLLALIALKRPDQVHVTGLNRVSDGLILSGWKQGNKERNDAAWAFKIDPQGKTIWESTLAQKEAKEKVYSATIAPDGNIMLAGRSEISSGDVGGLFIKVDSKNGKPIWSRRHVAKDVQLEASSVAVSTKGDILTVGRAGLLKKHDNNLWIAALTKDGYLAWQGFWGDEGNDEGTAVAVTNTGLLYAGGWTASNGQGGNDAWIIKLDASKKGKKAVKK